MKAFYTPKELIQILGFSKNTIYRYLEEGKINSNRVGKGSFRIPASEVEKWLGEKVPTANPPPPDPQLKSIIPQFIAAFIVFILLFGLGIRSIWAAKKTPSPTPAVAGAQDSQPIDSK